MPNPQNIPPFRAGEIISASALEGLRAGVAKRVRGLIGHSSSYSTATAQSTQRTRERIEILNNTGATIPAFSLFAVKRSGIINYPWGPPVRTEAFSFEAGLNYVTNYDYAIADTVAYPCLQVGSEPNLIRFNYQDGVPKIGHPIGPLSDGSINIKRCGYVVIAEPDVVNERVWIVKSNDQMVRVKLTESIAVDCRGDGKVISALPCGAVSPPPIDIFEDPDREISYGSEFVLREILNLTDSELHTNEVHFAHPTLGLGYVIIKSGPACDSIRFKVLSTGTNALSIRWAKVEVLSRPCGCSIVPEETEEDIQSVDTPVIARIYDMAGCFLNEPNADLVNRIGYAKYMQDIRFIDSEIESSGPGPDCAWEIHSLCCPTCEVPA